MCLALGSVKSINVDFLNEIRYFSIKQLPNFLTRLGGPRSRTNPPNLHSVLAIIISLGQNIVTKYAISVALNHGYDTTFLFLKNSSHGGGKTSGSTITPRLFRQIHRIRLFSPKDIKIYFTTPSMNAWPVQINLRKWATIGTETT